MKFVLVSLLLHPLPCLPPEPFRFPAPIVRAAPRGPWHRRIRRGI